MKFTDRDWPEAVWAFSPIAGRTAMFKITNRCDAKDTRGVERRIKGRRESANIMQVTNNNF